MIVLYHYVYSLLSIDLHETKKVCLGIFVSYVDVNSFNDFNGNNSH